MSARPIDGSSSRRRLGAVARFAARAAASVALAGVASVAFPLSGLDSMLVNRPVKAEARIPPAKDPATARDLGTYVGTWISDGGAHLIVARSGAVWSDGGELIGSARVDPADRSRMVFEGASFRCSYRLEASTPDVLLWNVVENTPGTACPAGRYTRRFTF